jgi:GTP-binding protein LepA
MEPERIRNFCVIAHIDHGKTTLTDRLLERTGTVHSRQMLAQLLDSMDLEREKGITIKAKAVRMSYHARDGHDYELNLIDTPGHVDFTYEVSRALAACEGALLLVDASQGIEAQTLANTYLAMEHDLTIIPIVNKIDLSSARTEDVAAELRQVLGVGPEEILRTSAKEGVGTDEVLEAVVQRIPAPRGDPQAPLRALIFDSHYDSYKGVVAYVRIVEGTLRRGDAIVQMASGVATDVLEVGFFHPRMTPVDQLAAGEVGYVATGLKVIRDCRVGDTITRADHPAAAPLPGYRPAKPMVFAGLYPSDPSDYALLRDALERLHLNDAALFYVPESSQALGAGFRCGFLGLLHMDICRERLEREFDMDILFTAPGVEYQILKMSGEVLTVENPAAMPDPSVIADMEEPWVRLQILAPSRYIGPLMELVVSRRGEYEGMEYLEGGQVAPGSASAQAASDTAPTTDRRVLLTYQVPLVEILVDFYDQLKSRSQGYASMDYVFSSYRPADVVKMDVLVNGVPVDALSVIINRANTRVAGRRLVEQLRRHIPRQLFDVPVQATIGGQIIARETIKARRKDVLAKCYGGDVTRKRKLLEKQRAGKKRMRMVGNVEIPQSAFLAVLTLDES